LIIPILNIESPVNFCGALLIPSKKPFPNKEAFLNWFVGFVDAEGNFLIRYHKEKEAVSFDFRIILHKDDKEILENIRNYLSVGYCRLERNNYYMFKIGDLTQIKNVLIPIFLSYPLQTTKKLDFESFYEAIQLYTTSRESSLNKIKTIKENMNKSRKYPERTNSLTPETSPELNPWWVVGFCDGESTFGIKNLTPYFQIPQHEKSHIIMSILGKFFPNSRYKKQGNVEIYSWGDIEILHTYVMRFFNEYNLQARKYIDYYLWSIVLNCHKLGYMYIPEGRELVVEISNCINKKRYTTNEVAAKFPDQKKIDELFKIPAPFAIYVGELSHEEKAKSFAIKKGSRQGFKVYVFEKIEPINHSVGGNSGTPVIIQVEGSPFKSYSAAQKKLKLSSRIVFRYIDTGKFFKEKYLFRSNLLTSGNESSANP
jgi:hypothetical protein